jgi:hypothetical protein
MGGLSTLDTNLDEAWGQDSEAMSHGIVDEASVSKNSEAKVLFVSTENLEQIQKVSSYKRFAACDGYVTTQWNPLCFTSP